MRDDAVHMEANLIIERGPSGKRICPPISRENG